MNHYIQIKDDTYMNGRFAGLLGIIFHKFKWEGVFVQIRPKDTELIYFQLNEVENFEIDGADIISSGYGEIKKPS